MTMSTILSCLNEGSEGGHGHTHRHTHLPYLGSKPLGIDVLDLLSEGCCIREPSSSFLSGRGETKGGAPSTLSNLKKARG